VSTPGRSASRTARYLVAVAIAVLSLGLIAVPAGATGSPVGGAGATFYLNDALGGVANRVFDYGDPRDVVHVGDWNGDGTDTPAIRRGNTFYLRNSNSTGTADAVVSYGDPGDVVLVGDWDGNGTDTLAVRRGGTYFIKNSLSSGNADVVQSYGDPGDRVLVGDWDGNRTDTLAVRRGGTYFVKNSLSTGTADAVIGYGDPGDTVLVGDWDGNGSDTLGVRRGGTYFIRNSLSSGTADRVFGYGNPDDTTFVGDWNGDGTDTLGVRRLAPGARGPFPIPVATGAAEQLITVVAPSAGSTTAQLTAWQSGPNGWTAVLGPVAARVGSAGIGAASESSTRTPAGTYTLTEAFGRAANPGTALPYRVVDRSDWWVSDVASPLYNRYARCAPGTCPFNERAGENLYAAGAVYDNAVVIDYNRGGTPGAGSAFFLHITNGAPTAGCVAVDRGSLTALMRWLDPAAAPLIAIGVG
jgi:L,D-peptidoglycan transpeptidase YkuD (ErfK/YbiS/YcfS/YnhG family)